MAPYQYAAYHNPYVATTAELLERKGEIAARQAEAIGAIQARAAEQQGNIWGSAIGNIGSIIANVPQQIQRQKIEAAQTAAIQTRTALEQQQLTTAQRVEQARQRISELASDPSVFNDDGTFNLKGIASKMASLPGGAAGPMQPPDLTTIAGIIDPLNEHIAKARDSREKWENDKTNALARIASTAFTLGAPNPQQPQGSYVEHAQVGLAAALRSGLITQDEANKFLVPMIERPDAVPQMLQRIAATSTLAPIKLGDGDKLLNPLNPSQVLATNEKPKPDYTVNGQRFKGDGTPIGSVVPPQHPAQPKSLQSKSVLVDGKPSEAVFNPTDGSWQVNGKPIDASRITPIPPASVQVNAANAAAANEVIKPDTREYRTAQDLAYGKLTFQDFTRLYPSRGSGPQAAKRSAIYDTARQLNPQFDPAQFELGYKMAGNPQIRQRLVAIDALSPVIDQVEALAEKVGNGDVPAFNRLIQSGKFQIGNKDVTNFRQLQTLLGDEVGNALGVGSGSDLKTRLGLDLVNPNLGPDQFRATMEQLRQVLGARRDTLLKTMGPYGGAASPGSENDPLGLFGGKK